MTPPNVTLPAIERRFIPARELRAAGSDKNPRIEGYAALFNTRSEDLGGFIELIVPGAFAEAIPASDIRALWNHNPDEVLGRTKAKTLDVTEDERGLFMSNTPPSWAARHVETIKRGDVDQMSFGFVVAPGGATWTVEGKGEDAVVLRTITKVQELFDVSPVTYPAYRATEVTVRSWTSLARAELDAWRSGTHNPDAWRAQIETLRRRHRQAMSR